jgi:hypothetical protein
LQLREFAGLAFDFQSDAVTLPAIFKHFVALWTLMWESYSSSQHIAFDSIDNTTLPVLEFLKLKNLQAVFVLAKMKSEAFSFALSNSPQILDFQALRTLHFTMSQT